MILEKIQTFKGFNSESICYTDMSGHPSLKSCLSSFLSERLFHNLAVDSKHLIVSAGCTALLYQLSMTLFNPGDGLLIPTPYYPVFDRDFKNLGQVHIQEVQSLAENNFDFTIEDLDNAYDRSLSAGHPPKVLLLTNPHNPLGTVCSREYLNTIITWCRGRHLHLITDEIYAMSTFGDKPFVSVVEMLDNKLGDDVHVLWGFSKDLGSSGLRIGVLYSQNDRLLNALLDISAAFQVSALTQQIAAHFLSDKEFMNRYLVENRIRLKKSYSFMETSLKSVGIHTIPAESSIFAFVDLRPLLNEPTYDAEKLLFEELATR
jgi:aspartate/methionine/tyrosine aminotransferase